MPGRSPASIPWTQIPVVATVARALAKDLTAQNEYLLLENSILRSKIPGRVLLNGSERQSLANALKEIPRELLAKIVSIVQPETALRWIRELVKKKWTCDNRPKKESPPPGRPRTAKEKEALVLRLARENSWGYDRIHGELVQMGIPVSETAVRDILRRNGLPLNPKKKGLSWCEFLRRHADLILCADFTTKEIWTFCGLTTVYILTVMHLKSRTVLLCEAAFSPRSQWLEQMARNAVIAAEDLGIHPAYMIHDRDPLFRDSFDPALRARGVDPVRTSRNAPDMNAHMERHFRSLKEECLDQLILIGMTRLRYVLDSWKTFFNKHRPHQGLEQRTPLQVLKGQAPPTPLSDEEISSAQVECVEFLGGLLRSYRRKAA